jgi:hypothetical protein
MYDFLNVGTGKRLKSGDQSAQKIRRRVDIKVSPTVNATPTHNHPAYGRQHKSHLTPGPGTYNIKNGFDQQVKRAKLFSRVRRKARLGKNADEVDGP